MRYLVDSTVSEVLNTSRIWFWRSSDSTDDAFSNWGWITCKYCLMWNCLVSLINDNPPLFKQKRKFWSRLAKMRQSSVRATLSPRQTLGPKPNGRNSSITRYFPSSSKKRSGLNIFGDSNTFGSKRVAPRAGMISVLTGISYPPMLHCSNVL